MREQQKTRHRNVSAEENADSAKESTGDNGCVQVAVPELS
jgi:hypothetical protein